MSNNIRENDLKAIERSIKNYLERKMTLMDMVNNIEMLAVATFDCHDTQKVYSFLINSIGEIEGEYFMNCDEVSDSEYSNYHPDVMKLVVKFQKKLKKYI